MRAYFKKKPDLVISVLFHLLVFIGLLVFFIFKSCSKDKSVYVFEMVDTAEELQAIAQPQSKPKPKVESKPPVPVEKVRTPIKRMDYEQFLKENAKPKPTTKPNPSSSQNTVKPLPKFQVEPSKKATAKSSQPVEASLLQEYGREVYQKISSQWNKPSSSLGSKLSVKVQFVVLSNGRIQSVKVLESSGKPVFDESILSVFKTINQFKPTPSGKKETFVMNFKLAD